MNVYFVTVIILLFYLALAWIVGALLRLQGASLWLFRGGLMLIGIVAAGLFLWFHHRLKRGKNLTPEQFAGAAEQLKLLLRQADQKLTAGRQGSLGSLPIVFVLGDLNSAKTSSILHSGLEPELIAGHVFRDSDVVPTATVNVWFAKKTVFIEAGGKLAANPQLWAQVLRQTRPKRISAAIGQGQQAPRAALVCVDSEQLASSQAAVQNLGNRLKEMARSLGAPFPVYVLFTKLDRLPHFADFVSNLTSEESAQILGATLPRGTIQGVFAEEENKRLTRAFDQIIYSLAEKRPDFLSRETVAEKTAGIYEFPRELRKSRNQVVQLLVDLTRPTQLSTNPFLRGFYFSGVRAVVINEAVSVPAAARTAVAPGSGATRMFNYAEEARAAAQNVPQRAVQSRKVPEWTFLPHLFTEVVLADRVAFSASHQSTRVDGLRRGLLISVVLLLLFFAVALLVSFIQNHNLENEVTQDAVHLNAVSGGPVVQSPTLDQLRTLDEMRGVVARLVQYQKGAPLSYRWGLYAGDRIYPDAYSLYFQNFRRLLLASTQARMVSVMNQPPSTISSDDFQLMYSTLKAYLITTSNHEHADWTPLKQALLDNSTAFKGADLASQDLIGRQFAFYAEVLPANNPYGPENDSAAIERARAYLSQFKGDEAIYQAMLDDAGKGKKPINFNRMFPQAAAFVVDNYEIPAAFTKDGYAVMQKSLQNPERFKGEEWVLGAPPTINSSGGSLHDTLANRYATDYLKNWRAYLRSGHVVGYGNLKEASAKLSRLAANDSPLLQLLLLAKENTAIDLPGLKDPFNAVQTIARDSTSERLVGSGNQEYMNTLSGLQNSILTVVNAPGPADPGMLNQVQQAASSATGTVSRIQMSFAVDTEGGSDKDKVDTNVSRLLREPIDYANDAAKRAGAAGAEDVCKMVNPVIAKKPFTQRSSQQATLQEVQELFRPQGTLWSTVQGKMGSMVQHQGANWVAAGSAPSAPGFLAFLNHAQQFTDTLFPGGSPNVHLTYTLQSPLAIGLYRTSLVIDGQSLNEPGHSQQFIWQGGNSSINLAVTAAGQSLATASFEGPWALFDFFNAAEWGGNNPATLDYALRSSVQLGNQQAGGGTKTSVRFVLTTQGTQIFKKEFLSSLHCSAH